MLPSSSESTDSPIPPDIGEIRQALRALRPAPNPFRNRPKQAAVALILAGEAHDPALCLIRRAEHEGDPWSGHMAFPGGRAEPEDPSPRAAAERETLEEVGLHLGEDAFLGPLAETPVYARGQDTGMVLFSFAYYLGQEKPRFQPNGEVAEVFWVPLSHLFDRRNQGEISIARDGVPFQLPTVDFRGHTVWGVTYRIFCQFAQALARPMPEGPLHPGEIKS